MSLVVAIKNKNEILMGCDSQVTCDGNKRVSNNLNKKMWKPQDGLLMGMSGDYRDINLLYTYEGKWIDAEHRDGIDLNYVVRGIVEKIYKELNTYGRVRLINGIASISSSVMVAFKGRIFLIGDDFSVIEYDDYAATGSGSQYGFGALEGIIRNLSRSIPMSNIDIILEVIKAGCANDIYESGPIIIMSTEDNEIRTF